MIVTETDADIRVGRVVSSIDALITDAILCGHLLALNQFACA